MSQPPPATALRAVRQRTDVVNIAPLQLEKADCDLELDEQMRRAAAKINQQLAMLDEAGMLCAMNYVYPLGNFARQLRIVPQASRFLAPTERLEGFALHMSPNAPVLALPFAELTMFNGILAVPLPQSKKLSLKFFADSANRILERLCSELSDTADLGTGDASNFAGFFYDAVAEQFYVVVQCHSDALARETWSLIAAAEPQSLADVDAAMRAAVTATNEQRRREHMVANFDVSVDINKSGVGATASAAEKPRYTTVDELFFRTPRMRELQRAQREHRLTVARRLCAMAGWSPGASLGLESPALIEATFNCVDQVDRRDVNSDRVLLSQLASVHQIGRSGTVYCETPRVFLLRGPWQTDSVVRRNRDMPEDAFIGVPVSSGRQQTLAARAVARTADWRTDEQLQPTETHAWPAGGANLLMDASNVRPRARDARFLQLCGSAGPSTETPLTPVAVRWARPTTQ